MKTRFRKYERSGWAVVEIPRSNLHDWDDHTAIFGNDHHYHKLQLWCKERCPEGSWVSHKYGSNHPNSGIKRFAFKEPKFATMFRLQWS